VGNEGSSHASPGANTPGRLTTRCLPRPQAREADPAGWAIGWGAWPPARARMGGALPASAGQLSSRPLGVEKDRG